jgi:hypothetical protein
MFRGHHLGATQAIVGFDVPSVTLANFESQKPEPWVWGSSHAYEFQPACYPILNQEIRNVEITFEE